jgi:CRISPR-associated RAMP protein (TIGR02581 family)
MFDTFKNRLILHGTLTTNTALRVGAGRNTNATETDLPVIKDAVGNPFIPGSSFKGVLRSRVESLLRAVITTPGRCNPRTTVGACNPIRDEERCIPPTTMSEQKQRLAQQARQKSDVEYDRLLTQWVMEHTCLACSLFGSPWLASQVQIKDWQVDRRYWFSQYLIRNGVSIDRDTETAGEGLLYNFEVVPAGTIFNGMIIVDNAEAWQLGLLLTGLREFDQGLPIGGATSRGLGSVAIEWDWSAASTYTDATDIWAYLTDPKSGQPISEALRQAWNAAMLTKLRSYQQKGANNA